MNVGDLPMLKCDRPDDHRSLMMEEDKHQPDLATQTVPIGGL